MFGELEILNQGGVPDVEPKHHVKNLGCRALLGYYSIWTTESFSTPNNSVVGSQTKCKIPLYFCLQAQIHSSEIFGEFQTTNTLEGIQLDQTTDQWRNSLNLANRVFAGYCLLGFTGDWKGQAKTAVSSLCMREVSLKAILGFVILGQKRQEKGKNVLTMSSAVVMGGKGIRW